MRSVSRTRLAMCRRVQWCCGHSIDVTTLLDQAPRVVSIFSVTDSATPAAPVPASTAAASAPQRIEPTTPAALSREEVLAQLEALERRLVQRINRSLSYGSGS